MDEAAEAEVRRLKKETKKEKKRVREEKSDREKVRTLNDVQRRNKTISSLTGLTFLNKTII